MSRFSTVTHTEPLNCRTQGAIDTAGAKSLDTRLVLS